MKNMRNYISIFILSLMAMMVVSCQDDDFYVAEGEPMEVSISATPQIPGMESRAVLGNEVNITKYTFLYFAGTDADSKLLHACEINPNDLPLQTILMSPGTGKTYSAILLANVSFSDLGLPSKPQTGINTTTTINLGDLVNKTKNIDRLMYALKDESGNTFSADKFTWSGYIGVTPENHSLNFVVCPNLAKMSMKVTTTSYKYLDANYPEGVSWRLKNVPTKVGFAQYALNQISGLNTAITDQEYIDYDMQDFSVKNEGDTHSDAWYIPQNMQGDVANARLDVNGNTAKPPTNATYLEFDVLSHSHNIPIASSYKIYPGIRESNVQGYGGMANFDVKSGYIYNMTVDISTTGIEGDVNNGFYAEEQNATAKIKLPTGTNCYMIHPIGDRIQGGTIYELPIDRVNEYWGSSTWGSGVGNVSGNKIDEFSEWKIEVIWQDINNRAIYFCDEYGNTITDDEYVGKGKNPFYFKLNSSLIPYTYCASTKDIYGNVLVGLRKKNADNTYGDILWSWHLWITDYVPDNAPAYTTSVATNRQYYLTNIDYQGVRNYVSGTYPNIVYNKTNTMAKWGNVQHYYDYRNFFTNTSSIWNSGIYASKWIMDRNLGAQSPNNTDIEDPIDGFGLYYQYGRKDPFPYVDTSHKLYKINGSTVVTLPTPQPGNVTMNVGVNNPTIVYHYSHGGGHNSWTSSRNNRAWYSPVTISDNKKTIYDPCPDGWQLPTSDIVACVNYYNSSADISKGVANVDVTRGTYSSSGTSNRLDLLRCMSIIQLKHNSSVTDPFDTAIAIQGYLSPSAGTLVKPTAADARGYLWTRSPNTSSGSSGQGIGHGCNSYNVGNIVEDGHDRNGRWIITYGSAVYVTSFSASRGQNVRCIQE